jgi:hypothetical protein
MTTDIASVRHGIIFLMAEWSGSAQMAKKQLTDILAHHHLTSQHLICIDVDREPSVYDLPEFAGKIHGNGEAAVVRDGRIVFVTSLGKNKNLIHERCEELLRFYEHG